MGKLGRETISKQFVVSTTTKPQGEFPTRVCIVLLDSEPLLGILAKSLSLTRVKDLALFFLNFTPLGKWGKLRLPFNKRSSGAFFDFYWHGAVKIDWCPHPSRLRVPFLNDG